MSLRIIGGAARSRRIPSPEEEGVRPTGERVREALFNIWGGAVEGARVLDLCAGSGAISLEALSRGATSVVAVEKNRRLCEAMRRNAEVLGLAEGLEVRSADVNAEIERIRAESPHRSDLAFADPPWREDTLRREVLEAVFAPEPICASLVMEAPRNAQRESEVCGVRLVRERRYGDTCLLFFEANSAGLPDDAGERK